MANKSGEAGNKRPQSIGRVFYAALILVTLVAVALNTPAMQFDHFKLWIRIIDPTLLLIGFVGSFYKSRVAWFVGWLGVIIFTICGLQLALPGEDYISGGPDGPALMAPRLESVHYIVFRLTIVIMVLAALATCLWKMDTK